MRTLKVTIEERLEYAMHGLIIANATHNTSCHYNNSYNMLRIEYLQVLYAMPYVRREQYL